MDHYEYRKELARYVEACHQFQLGKLTDPTPAIRIGMAHHANEAANASQNLADHHTTKDRVNTVPAVVWNHLAGRWISTMLEYAELPDAPLPTAPHDKPIPAGGTTP